MTNNVVESGNIKSIGQEETESWYYIETVPEHPIAWLQEADRGRSLFLLLPKQIQEVTV